MTATSTTSRPLTTTREHLDGYGAFLTRVLALAARYETVRRSLGPYALEEFHRQTSAIEVAKRDGPDQFDIRNEAGRFIQTLTHNFNVMQEKNEAFREQLDRDLARIEAVRQSERYLVWLTPYGKHLVQRAYDFGAITKGTAMLMPSRVDAWRATVIAAYHMFNLAPPPEALQFALESVWRAYQNYYGDRHVLMTKLAGAFNEQAKEVFDALQTIDERIAAREAAQARAAEERENARRQAELSTDDDDDIPTASGNRAISHAPVESSDYDWNWDQDDRYSTYSSHYDVNPASGLSMTGHGIDVMGNPYGFDLFSQ